MVTVRRRLGPRGSSPPGLVGVGVHAVFSVLADVHDASLSCGIAFREVHAVGYADIPEVFVIVHNRQAGVVVALVIGWLVAA